MIERTPVLNAVTHTVLILAVLSMCFPIWIGVVTATLPDARVGELPKPLLPDGYLLENMARAWERGQFSTLFMNSMISATTIMVGKIAIAMVTAFGLVYFNFVGRTAAFWMVFITLMLPLEVRMVPTYEVASNALLPLQRILEWTGIAWAVETASGIRIQLNWSMINTYAGLTLPLIATATGTFLFRQFYLTLPDELTEAAKLDGASPMRFFWDMVVPLSRTNMAALGIIMFVFGWNQYLWPLLVTTGPDYRTMTLGLRFMEAERDQLTDWNVMLAGALIVMAPPVTLVIVAQRWFVKGLVNTEK